MAMPFIGQNDFRGYLNYLSQNGDAKAGLALNFTGNDGGVDEANMRQWLTGDAMVGGDALAASQASELDGMRNYVSSAYGDWSGNALGAPTTTPGGRTTGARTVSAPSNDFYGPGGSQRNSRGRTYDEQAAEDERVKQQQLGLYDEAIGEADKGFGVLDEQKRIGLENVAGSYIGDIPMRNCLLFHNRKYISKVIHTEEVAYDLVCNIINRRRASI